MTCLPFSPKLHHGTNGTNRDQQGSQTKFLALCWQESVLKKLEISSRHGFHIVCSSEARLPAKRKLSEVMGPTKGTGIPTQELKVGTWECEREPGVQKWKFSTREYDGSVSRVRRQTAWSVQWRVTQLQMERSWSPLPRVRTGIPDVANGRQSPHLGGHHFLRPVSVQYDFQTFNTTAFTLPESYTNAWYTKASQNNCPGHSY